jgi:phosphoribosylpyrophosphate synthetase
VAIDLISEISFGSYLVYSPRGSTDVSTRSRAVRSAIKAGNEGMISRIVERMAEHFETTPLRAVLGPDVLLIPAPRSAPLVSGGLWPGLLVCRALAKAGFGRDVLACLDRIEAVPKSAFQAPGGRPTARRHWETIRVDVQLVAARRITLVDDIVTKGNTLLGAASRLAEVFPGRDVSTFALVRTKGRQAEIEAIIDPCLGVIRRSGDEADREP